MSDSSAVWPRNSEFLVTKLFEGIENPTAPHLASARVAVATLQERLAEYRHALANSASPDASTTIEDDVALAEFALGTLEMIFTMVIEEETLLSNKSTAAIFARYLQDRLPEFRGFLAEIVPTSN